MIFPNKSIPHIIRTPLVLTSSYVAGTVVGIDEANMIGLECTYVKGDETSIEIKVESSIDEGTTYAQQVTQSTSGGTSTLTPGIYSMTAASAAATQIFTLIITPIKGSTVRISAKATGGTPTGTLGLKAITGWA